MSENVAPNAPYTSRIVGLPTGLTGTLGVRILDNAGA